MTLPGFPLQCLPLHRQIRKVFSLVWGPVCRVVVTHEHLDCFIFEATHHLIQCARTFAELPKSSYCLAPVELRVLLPGSTEHEHQRTEEEGSEDERQTYQSYRNSCYILHSLHPILSCFKMHAISTNYLGSEPVNV